MKPMPKKVAYRKALLLQGSEIDSYLFLSNFFLRCYVYRIEIFDDDMKNFFTTSVIADDLL